MSAAVDTQATYALSEALRLVEHGYRLTPVTITRGANGKKDFRFHGNGLRGDQFKGWRHESAWSRDSEQIRAWWVDYPETSFAIGGAANATELVDLDVKPAEGLDGVTWWSERGLPLSAFVQHTPSGGRHLIWRCRADGLALPQEAGKTFGRGIDTRNRSGLVIAAGGYVVGEEGSYELEGALPRLDELEEVPREVIDLFADAEAQERAERPTDGRIVVHDEKWQRERVELAMQAIRNHRRDEGGYRKKLQHAALFYGRIVEQGFLPDLPSAERRILEAHCSVWGPAVWPENRKDIRDALKDGPRLERWRVPALPQGVNGHSGLQSAHIAPIRPDAFFEDSPAAAEPGVELDQEEEAQRSAYELEVQHALRQLDVRSEARRRAEARDREPLAVLDLDAFLDAPQPDYLLPRALYRNGTAKVFGPPGGTKSFFLLDMALSLASGTPWHGMELEQATVHYVMAEGQATNTARALAWFHHRGVPREEARGRFVAIPQGVLLTPEGVAGYLEQVRRDRPALVILDTKNRMMVGEENSASDVGIMVRTMDEIRRAADGAAVVLVDHTGIADATRGRGSNAVEAAMDIEIRVSRDESGLGVAEVTRDKAAEPGARWSYRIERVEGVAGLRPGTPTPAVPVPADLAAFGTPLALGRSTWWDVDQPPVPDELVTCTEKGADAARDVFRVLRWVNDSEGIERARITEALAEGPRKWGKSTVTAGLALMVRRGWADKPTQGRYTLGFSYQNEK